MPRLSKLLENWKTVWRIAGADGMNGIRSSCPYISLLDWPAGISMECFSTPSDWERPPPFMPLERR